MRNFDYEKLKNQMWDNETISYLTQIHEYKGKQELFTRQKPVELERLVEIAKVQSTEASNQIEGIITTEPRLKKLVADKTTPKNRAEEEILGYRNVLNLIHENHNQIPLSPNYILQLHGEMLRFTSSAYAGKFKATSNEIAKVYSNGEAEVLFRPLEPFETPDAVRRICESYESALAREACDPLILIPCFILDFLCIHPFSDAQAAPSGDLNNFHKCKRGVYDPYGNGRMSRLLTLLLLYKSGYMVGKYISIEKAICDTKESYYDVLARSDENWHEEKNDPKSFIKYMLAVILSCYREFEKRVGIVNDAGVKSKSYDIVKNYVMEKLGKFTKQEVLECCPSLASSSVEAALKKLVDEGTVTRLGVGRSTRYVRTN